MKARFTKPLLIAGVTAGLAVSSLAAVGAASAATDNSGPTGLIDKIASKFNLNKDEVAAVFEEERKAHEAERKTKADERLSKAVSDGKITADQKAKIIAKQAELKAARDADKDAMKNKTPTERRAAMEAKRTELEKWAKDNGIPTEYLHPAGGHKGPGGPGMGPRADKEAANTNNQ